MTDMTPAPRRLDHVASEFEPHNLALQAHRHARGRPCLASSS